MRIIRPKLTLEPGEGFKNDILDRKEFGISLKHLVSNSEDSLVIALNSEWGEGKTTFVQRWRDILNEDNIQSIYFDAFENDYLDDAYIAIVSAVISYVNNEGKSIIPKNKSDQVKTQAIKIGGQLLSLSIKLGIKAATLGLLKDSEIEEIKYIKDDLAKDSSSVLSKYVEEKIDSYNTNHENFNEFKKQLTDICLMIKEKVDAPLVVIIDELDRCKPTFAIEIIEKIKHLFSVDNLIFVLVMHKPQLEEALKSVYGSGLDANLYLQKFISIECNLPKKKMYNDDSDHDTFSRHLWQLHEISIRNSEDIRLAITTLSQHLNLSLRELEKCFTYLSLFAASSNRSQTFIPTIISLVIILKIKFPKLLYRIQYAQIEAEELLDQLELSKIDAHNNSTHPLRSHVIWINYCLMSDKNFKELPDHNIIKHAPEKYPNLNLRRNDIILWHLRLIDVFMISTV